MLRNGKTLSLATAALLLLSVQSISIAWAEDAAVSKRSAYPELKDQSSTSNKPGMTAGEQEKLKNDLINARERSQVKAKENAARPKPKKPEGRVQ
jgi:hypothetical protein